MLEFEVRRPISLCLLDHFEISFVEGVLYSEAYDIVEIVKARKGCSCSVTLSGYRLFPPLIKKLILPLRLSVKLDHIVEKLRNCDVFKGLLD